MPLKAGTAYVDVAAKVAPSFDNDVAKGITPGMDSAGKKAGGVLSSSIGKAASVAAGGVIAAKATQFLSGAVDAARESARVAAQSQQVIKSTGGAANITADQMGKLAGSIAKVTGVDDEAIQSAENLLATFTSVRNETGKGNKVFDQATKTITDMSAVQGSLESNTLLVGKALQDPIKGLSALHRVGVDFNDQQKAQIETMVKAGDTAGAQKVILSELGREFGGQAEAQATSAGKLKVAWGNVEESIGQKLIPVLEKVSGFLADHTGLILPLAGLIGGILVIAFTAWAISAAAAAAATIAAALPVLAIIAAIALLAAGIYLLVTNWDVVWSKITEIAGAAWDWIKGAFSAAWQWIQGIWDSGLNAIKGAWNSAWDTVKEKVSGAWSAVTGAVSGGIGRIVSFFTELPGKVLSAISSLPGKMLDFGKKLIAKLIDGIKSAPGAVAGAIGGAIKGAASHVPVVGGLFKAEGGPVSSSRPYIVGERGPELFVPRVSGGIVSHAQMTDALGQAGGSSSPLSDRPIHVDARGARDPWGVGDKLNRSLRELAYAEGWDR